MECTLHALVGVQSEKVGDSVVGQADTMKMPKLLDKHIQTLKLHFQKQHQMYVCFHIYYRISSLDHGLAVSRWRTRTIEIQLLTSRIFHKWRNILKHTLFLNWRNTCFSVPSEIVRNILRHLRYVDDLYPQVPSVTQSSTSYVVAISMQVQVRSASSLAPIRRNEREKAPRKDTRSKVSALYYQVA